VGDYNRSTFVTPHAVTNCAFSEIESAICDCGYF